MVAALRPRLKEQLSCFCLDMTFFTCVHQPLAKAYHTKSMRLRCTLPQEAQRVTCHCEDLHTRKQMGTVSSNIIYHSPIVPYKHCSVGSHLFLIGSLFSCGFNYNICKNNIQITSLILFVSLKIQFKILNHLLEIYMVYISIPITTSLDMC